AAVVEPTVELPPDGAGLAEIRLVLAETLVCLEYPGGRAGGPAGEIAARAATLAELRAAGRGAVAHVLGAPLPERPRSGGRAGATRRLPSRHAYERLVVRAKEHTRAGAAFQIVLSQRAERPTSASALGLYRSLRRVNPSPYLFL